MGVPPVVTTSASTSAARVKSKHRDDDRVRAPQQLSAAPPELNVGIGGRLCSMGGLSVRVVSSNAGDRLPESWRVSCHATWLALRRGGCCSGTYVVLYGAF